MTRMLYIVRQTAYTVFAFACFLGMAIELTVKGFFLITVCGATDAHKQRFHKLLQRRMRFAATHVPGTTFTLRGKGIPYINNSSRRGDLVFRVNVEIPKGLNEKQKAAMKAFAESCGETNYTKHKAFFKKIFGQK